MTLSGAADSPAASLALSSPASRRSRGKESERGTAGVKTEKFRGLSAKSVTQGNSAQWTAGCFRGLSGVFLQNNLARAAAGQPGRFRRCWAVVGRMRFSFSGDFI